MKAMILAAGLGKRMRPLTDKLPKPLLPVAGKPLIYHHLEKLKSAGVDEVVINIAYLGHLIREDLGDGARFGLKLYFSEEEQPLETGGAINKALPLLGSDPFLLVNGDVWADYDLNNLLGKRLPDSVLGHLVMVPNPEHCAQGNFSFERTSQGDLLTPVAEGRPSYTFSGISLLRPELVSAYPQCREYFPLRESFFWAMESSRLSGEVFEGHWVDVGTPDRLRQLEQYIS